MENCKPPRTHAGLAGIAHLRSLTSHRAPRNTSPFCVHAGARVVAKAYPEEKVGVFAQRGGRLEVVEYSGAWVGGGGTGGLVAVGGYGVTLEVQR